MEQNYAVILNRYNNLRVGVQVSVDNIPQLIRDVFDIFVQTQNSRQFVKRNSLVDDSQKRKIYGMLLKCCAFSGPDGQKTSTDSTKVSSRFLDLGKINQDDYQFDGIQICIKWFCEILASSKQKKDQDECRKIKATFEEIEKSVQGA
jgi:hypothetical protein